MALPNVELRELQVNLRSSLSNFGEIVDIYDVPTNVTTYQAVIPSVALGNEPRAGYAAFTDDGITANCGLSTYTDFNFLGFFILKTIGDERDSNGNSILGNNFSVPVCTRGRLYVYNSTPVLPLAVKGLQIITSVPVNSSSIFQVGGVAQGMLPTGTTSIDITSYCRVKYGSAKAGSGILIDILKR
jgi:hypothetical protein